MFGGLNMLQGNTKGYVTQTAIATNVATVTVTITTGPLPLVGDLITIWATSQQTGLFNVKRAIITAVNITGSTGAGTISYALTGSNQSATADAGAFLTEPGETSEALVNSSSQPVAIQAPQGDSQFTVPVSVTFPSLPTTATVHLQAAIRDIDAEYTNVDGTGIATVAGGVQTAGPLNQVTLQRGYVYRINVSSVTGGTSPSIIAKIG
jgi:hypothetical protein